MKWPSLLLTLTLVSFNSSTFAGGDDNPLVSIKDFKFIPQEITIKRGQSINWLNQEKRQYHSVWFEKLGLAESDYLFPSDSYEQKFDHKGSFPYRCGPHPQMTGLVIVE